MQRIIIIGEGPTEQEFCKDILIGHFITKGIAIQYPTIKKTTGGITSWEALKHQIQTHLKQDRSVYVTTLIDYYGIYANLKFPGWQEANNIVNKFERVEFLENAMLNDIGAELNDRFIPYLQLHEFEGLLFNNIATFKANFTEKEILNITELENIINEYPNPELINDNVTTAPSKRLKRHIPSYNKIVYGACLADSIGLKNIREKCSHFNDWISSLELLSQLR